MRTLSERDNWLGGLWASQLALTARRKEMAAERVERLDPQVALLRGIHDSAVRDDEAASGDGETVGVIGVDGAHGGGQEASRWVKRIVDERPFLALCRSGTRRSLKGKATLRDVAAQVLTLEHQAACTDVREMAVVLTAAGRLGEDPQHLVAAIERSGRSSVWVLSAAEEAELVFVRAAQPAAPHQRLAVCDMAGGSTELAFATAADGVERTYCFDTGALRLPDRCLPSAGSADRAFEAARREARRQLNLDRIPRCDLRLASGGSARAGQAGRIRRGCGGA